MTRYLAKMGQFAPNKIPKFCMYLKVTIVSG